MPRKAETKRCKQGGKAKGCPVLPNHKYLQDPAAVSDRCRVIRKNPYLRDRAAGPPDEHWTWEELIDPVTRKKVKGWFPDDTVPATGPVCPFPPEKEDASGGSPVDTMMDTLMRPDESEEADMLVDMLNHPDESKKALERRERRGACSRGFNRALRMREADEFLPDVPDYTGKPEVDEKNLRQWCIKVLQAQADKPGGSGSSSASGENSQRKVQGGNGRKGKAKRGRRNLSFKKVQRYRNILDKWDSMQPKGFDRKECCNKWNNEHPSDPINPKTIENAQVYFSKHPDLRLESPYKPDK